MTAWTYSNVSRKIPDFSDSSLVFQHHCQQPPEGLPYLRGFLLTGLKPSAAVNLWAAKPLRREVLSCSRKTLDGEASQTVWSTRPELLSRQRGVTQQHERFIMSMCLRLFGTPPARTTTFYRTLKQHFGGSVWTTCRGWPSDGEENSDNDDHLGHSGLGHVPHRVHAGPQVRGGMSVGEAEQQGGAKVAKDEGPHVHSDVWFGLTGRNSNHGSSQVHAGVVAEGARENHSYGPNEAGRGEGVRWCSRRPGTERVANNYLWSRGRHEAQVVITERFHPGKMAAVWGWKQQLVLRLIKVSDGLFTSFWSLTIKQCWNFLVNNWGGWIPVLSRKELKLAS